MDKPRFCQLVAYSTNSFEVSKRRPLSVDGMRMYVKTKLKSIKSIKIISDRRWKYDKKYIETLRS